MLGYKLGDPEAFDALYKRHAGRMYGYLRRRVSSAERADDVFQETLLRLHRNRSKYDHTKSFLPWLFTLCHNTLVDHVRKLKAWEQACAGGEGIGQALLHPDERAASLGEIYHRLSAEEQRVLSLRFAQDLPFKDIAMKLDIEPTSARKIASRAIVRLRRLISE